MFNDILSKEEALGKFYRTIKAKGLRVSGIVCSSFERDIILSGLFSLDKKILYSGCLGVIYIPDGESLRYVYFLNENEPNKLIGADFDFIWFYNFDAFMFNNDFINFWYKAIYCLKNENKYMLFSEGGSFKQISNTMREYHVEDSI